MIARAAAAFATAIALHAAAGTPVAFVAVGPGEFLVTTGELRADKGASPSRRDVPETGKRIWSGNAAATVKLPVKLSAATRYRWTVMTPQGVVGEAGFETLAAEPLASVEISRESAGSFSRRALHALLLQDLGADQDAHAACAELARERPDLPELAALAR